MIDSDRQRHMDKVEQARFDIMVAIEAFERQCARKGYAMDAAGLSLLRRQLGYGADS